VSELELWFLKGEKKQMIIDMMALMVIFELDDYFGVFYLSVFVRGNKFGQEITDARKDNLLKLAASDNRSVAFTWIMIFLFLFGYIIISLY